jgi:hypothetical protein
MKNEQLAEMRIQEQARNQREFLVLAKRFRSATNPEESNRLGDQLGRLVFGD